MCSKKVVMNCSARKKCNERDIKFPTLELNKSGTRNKVELDNTSGDSEIQVVDTNDLVSSSAIKAKFKRKTPAKRVEDLILSDSNSDSDFLSKKPPKKKITSGKNLSQSMRSTQLQKEERQKVVSDKQRSSQIEATKYKKVEVQSATKISSEKAENKEDLHSGSGPMCGSVDLKSYVFLDGVLEEMEYVGKMMKDRSESLKNWYLNNSVHSSDALPLAIRKLQRTIKLSSDSLTDVNSMIDKYKTSFGLKQERNLLATGEILIKTENGDTVYHNDVFQNAA